MQPADKIIVHQVHPAKIDADVTASVVSDVLGGPADEICLSRNHQGCRVVLACMAARHTITIIPANRHIEVCVGGHKLAESDRAMRRCGRLPQAL